MAIPMTPAALALLEQVAAAPSVKQMADDRMALLEQAANDSRVPPAPPVAAPPAPEIGTPAPAPAPGYLELVARAGAAAANPMMEGPNFVGAVAQKAKAAYANAPPSAPLPAGSQEPLPGAGAAPAAPEGPPAPTVVDLGRFGGAQQPPQQGSAGAGVSSSMSFAGAPGAAVGDQLRAIKAAETAMDRFLAALKTGDNAKVAEALRDIESLQGEQEAITGQTRTLIDETRAEAKKALAKRDEVLRRADEMYSEAAVFERYPGATASEVPALLDATRTLQKQVIPADEMARMLNAGRNRPAVEASMRSPDAVGNLADVAASDMVGLREVAAGRTQAERENRTSLSVAAAEHMGGIEADDARVQAIRDNYATEEEASRARSFLAQKSRPEDVYPQGWALALSLIGVGLGGLGQRPGEENHALRIMQAGIDRKIAMQKAEAERRQQGVVSARNMYESIRARANDDVTAVATTRAAMLEQNATMLRMVGERVTSKKMQADILQAADAAHRESVRQSAEIQAGIGKMAYDRAQISIESSKMKFAQSMALQEMEAKKQSAVTPSTEYFEPIPGYATDESQRKKVEDISDGLTSVATTSRELLNLGFDRASAINELGGGKPGLAEQVLAAVMTKDVGWINSIVQYADDKDRDKIREYLDTSGSAMVLDEGKFGAAISKYGLNDSQVKALRKLATISGQIRATTIPLMGALGKANGSGVLQPAEVEIWFGALGRQDSATSVELEKVGQAYKVLYQNARARVRSYNYRLRDESFQALGLLPGNWNITERFDKSLATGTPDRLEVRIPR